MTAGPGAQYSSSVLFAEGSTTEIIGSKLDMRYKANVANEASTAIEAMTELRNEVAKLAVGDKAYPYTFEFLTWETFVVRALRACRSERAQR